MSSEAITTWLRPLQLLLDAAGKVNWQRLEALAAALDALLTVHPVGADLPPGTERSRRLQAIRRELAQRGHLDATGEPALFQVLAQF